MPTLWRKKGTEKLAPISCAHAEAEEGYEKLAPVSCAHTEAEEGAQAELVRSMAALRYEPCTQFINVSQRALHIYFIDGCRRIKSKNKNSDLCASSQIAVSVLTLHGS